MTTELRHSTRSNQGQGSGAGSSRGGTSWGHRRGRRWRGAYQSIIPEASKKERNQSNKAQGIKARHRRGVAQPPKGRGESARRRSQIPQAPPPSQRLPSNSKGGVPKVRVSRGEVRALGLGCTRVRPHERGVNLRMQLSGHCLLPHTHCRPLAAPPGPHRSIGDRVGAQGRVLAGEGATGGGHQARAACTGALVRDEAVRPWSVGRRRWAAQGRVVGATHRQEVRCGVTGHYLSRVCKDGRGEEAERVHPWRWGGKRSSRFH